MDARYRALLGILTTAVVLSPGLARAAVPTDFVDELVVDGLDQPTGLAFLPDGRLLVLEQNARNVRLVVQETLAVSPILTIADVNTSGNERGLLGVAVDPGWPSRPYLYFHFTRTPGNTVYIARYTASGDLSDGTSTNLSLGDRYDILTDVPDNAQNHNGGTLRFGIDGMLYASFGEDAFNCAAQDSTDLRGVILRLDVSGLPSGGGGPPAKSLITPPDNPFPSTNANAGLTFAFGLRNPFRFDIDSETGHLYIGDVGERYFEEMDEATGGENFGWPYREGTNVRDPNGCNEPGGPGSQTYVDPIGGYDRTSLSTAAIIGGPRYRDVLGGIYRFPSLYDGAVFFSDYYSGFVRVIQENGNGWAPLPAVPGQPNANDWATGITNVGQFQVGPDGAIYYTKQFPGSVRRIVYASPTGVGGDGGTVPRPLGVRPNPFLAGGSPLTVDLGEGLAGAIVEIFSLSGARVRMLVPSGPTQHFTWNGRDDESLPVPAGVYFLSARTENARATTRFVLLR